MKSVRHRCGWKLSIQECLMEFAARKKKVGLADHHSDAEQNYSEDFEILEMLQDAIDAFNNQLQTLDGINEECPLCGSHQNYSEEHETFHIFFCEECSPPLPPKNSLSQIKLNQSPLSNTQ